MITEIIEYKLKESADEEWFLMEAEKYNAYFKATFKGFIDLEFTKGENGWINIMRWETMEDVKVCGEVLRTGPQEVAGYAALADRASTKLTFLECKLYHAASSTGLVEREQELSDNSPHMPVY